MIAINVVQYHSRAYSYKQYFLHSTTSEFKSTKSKVFLSVHGKLRPILPEKKFLSQAGARSNYIVTDACGWPFVLSRWVWKHRHLPIKSSCLSALIGAFSTEFAPKAGVLSIDVFHVCQLFNWQSLFEVTWKMNGTIIKLRRVVDTRINIAHLLYNREKREKDCER